MRDFSDFDFMRHGHPGDIPTPSRNDDIGTQSATKPTNQHLDSVGQTIVILGIKMFGNFQLGDDLTRPVRHEGQKAILLRRERNGQSSHGDLFQTCVQGVLTYRNNRRRKPGSAPHQRPDTRYNFLHPERLHDVVIRTGFDTFDPFTPVSTGCEDENWSSAPVAAPPLENGQSIQARKAEIQNDCIECLRFSPKPGVLTVCR